MPAPSRILYVDDNRDSCELVRQMLRFSDLNCEVETVETAEDAEFLLKTQDFDLFILDYALPLKSGVELCLHIRENRSTTPVMFFTAMAGAAYCADAMNAGANEYLVKPDDLENLVETVKRLLIGKMSFSCLVPVLV
jgi:two-component system, OmpR family, manganese sensing response regulator